MRYKMLTYFNSFKGTYEQKVTQAFKICQKILDSGNFCYDPNANIRNIREHYDFTPYLMKKRINATVLTRYDAHKKLKGVSSDHDIDAMMMYSNSLILRGGYATNDINLLVVFASAFWILDQLSIQGMVEDAYKYLPAIDENDVLIGIHHPHYDIELITAVIKLIIFRNEEKYGIMDLKQQVLLKSKGEYKPRKNYDAVISLIDPQAIMHAKNEYEKKVWEFYHLSFSSYVKLEEERDKISKEIETLKNKSFSPLSILSMNPDSCFNLNNPIKKEIENLEYKLDLINRTSWFTILGLPDSREKTTKRFRHIIGEELADKITRFEVEDPFESAFALNMLLDEENHIPWLYYGSICVTYTFVDQLPFNNQTAEMSKTKLSKISNNILYTHKFKGIRFENRTDCHGEDIERTYGKNLSQILFYNSSTLYPRIAKDIPQLESFFNELGLNNENDKQLYTLLIHLMCAKSDFGESLREYRLNQEIEKMLEAETETMSQNGYTEDREKEILKLHKEIKMLKKALYEEHASKKSAVSKCDKVYLENERLIRELSDLRELIFTFQNNDHVDDTEESQIQFPASTKGRVVSFGGHPSWIKEMKNFLPDVVFFSPDSIPNKDVIKNADQVWIQTQCISHSAFYRIVSSLSSDTQIRYFKFKSAKRCAEQFFSNNF